MLGLLSYGVFLLILGALMRAAWRSDSRERTDTAAAMLAARVH